MSDGTRAKRPEPEREAPIRSWSTLRAAKSGGAAAANGATTERLDDVIVRSVELGYRVIDDYIKRGQAAAQRMQHGAYGAGDMARDAQGVAGQLVRSATDLAGAWAEFFALTVRDGGATGNGANGNGHAPAASPAEPFSAPVPAPERPMDPLRVRLQVTANRAVETALDLRPVPADHGLAVHALRGAGSARIDDVRVETRDGSAVIAIRVAADLPPGQYTGLVVDDTTNVPAGEITVVLVAE